MRRARSAFTLFELAAALAVVGVLSALLLAALSDARRNAGLDRSINNLKRFGVGVFVYAADYGDLFPSYSWTADEGQSQWDDFELLRQTGGINASGAQALDLARQFGQHAIPIRSSWAVHARWGHLPLLDHLGEHLYLSDWVASPGDKSLHAWRQHPYGCVVEPQGCWGDNWKWAYSSSYEIAPTFWLVEEAHRPEDRIYQAAIHTHYHSGPDSRFQSRRISTIRYPSQKAMVYERHGWFFGRPTYVSHAEARLPVLAGDGAVDVRVTGDANAGWKPNHPDSLYTTNYKYYPRNYEPPSHSGSGDPVTGYIRWTRHGALGRDWGGPEVGR